MLSVYALPADEMNFFVKQHTHSAKVCDETGMERNLLNGYNSDENRRNMKKIIIILLLIVAGVFFYIAALDKYCDQREDFMLGICEITKFFP